MDLQVVVFSCLFYNYNSYLAQNSSFFVFFVFFFFFFLSCSVAFEGLLLTLEG